jgi:hypothetical protein
VLAEERRLQLLRAWRAFIARLEHRWEEDPPQTAREITVVLDVMQTLVNESVIGEQRVDIPDEAVDLRVIRMTLETLNTIADSVQKDERRVALLRVIEGERSA